MQDEKAEDGSGAAGFQASHWGSRMQAHSPFKPLWPWSYMGSLLPLGDKEGRLTQREARDAAWKFWAPLSIGLDYRP